MSRFLKLTNFLINVNQIRRIDMPPGAYKIYLMPCEYSGLHFMGSGYITSASESYTVSEKDHISLGSHTGHRAPNKHPRQPPAEWTC